MRNVLPRLALAACLILPNLFESPANAAQSQGETGAVETPAAADQAEQQRRLTEKDVTSFIAAAKPVEAILGLLPEDKRDDPDATALAALDKAAKLAGLKGYADYDELAANIGFVLQGFDPDKKTFVGPKAILEAKIAQANADRSMSKREKAQALKELEDDLANFDTVQFPDNITLVTKHYDELAGLPGP